MGDAFSFLTPIYSGASSVGGWMSKMIWGTPAQQPQSTNDRHDRQAPVPTPATNSTQGG
jgi:hypothetical protein